MELDESHITNHQQQLWLCGPSISISESIASGASLLPWIRGSTAVAVLWIMPSSMGINGILVWYKWWSKYLRWGALLWPIPLSSSLLTVRGNRCNPLRPNSWGSLRTWQIVRPRSNTLSGESIVTCKQQVHSVRVKTKTHRAEGSNDKVWCPLSQHPELVQSRTTLLTKWGSQRIISTLHWTDVVLIISCHLGLSCCKSWGIPKSPWVSILSHGRMTWIIWSTPMI